jgi:hypothetical protein
MAAWSMSAWKFLLATAGEDGQNPLHVVSKLGLFDHMPDEAAETIHQVGVLATVGARLGEATQAVASQELSDPDPVLSMG